MFTFTEGGAGTAAFTRSRTRESSNSLHTYVHMQEVLVVITCCYICICAINVHTGWGHVSKQEHFTARKMHINLLNQGIAIWREKI